MIVKMKKLTLLCLAAMKQNTVDRLADLGAVQVTADKLMIPETVRLWPQN